MKKIILSILLSFIIVTILLLLAILYLNKTYIPTKAKAYLIESIEKNIDYKADIADLKLSLTKGITIKNLTLYKDTPEEFFLSTEEINLIVLFWPLFKKTIIIPSASINNAHLDLKRNQDGSLNLPKIQSKKNDTNFSFFIKKIAINDSAITFIDNSLKLPLEKKITAINSTITLSILKNISLKTTATINEKSNIAINGAFTPDTNMIKLKTKIDQLDLKDYTQYLQLEKLNIEKSLLSDAALNTVIDLNQKTIGLDSSLKKIKAQLKINNINTSITSALNLKLSYDLTTKEISYYNCLIKPESVQIEGIPKLDKLSLSNGEVTVSNNKALIKEVFLNYKNNLIKIEGEITNITERSLNLHLNSQNIDLSSINHLFIDKLQNISIFGNIIIDTLIKGKFDSIDNIFFNGSIITDNTNIAFTENNIDFNDIKGKILFTKNSLSWDNLNCLFKEKTLTSKGDLKDFQYPNINTNIKYSNFDIDTSLNVVDKAINIGKLSIKAFDSILETNGIIKLDKNNFFKVKSNLNLNLENLKTILPEVKVFQTLPLKGSIKLILDCNGPFKTPRLWQAKATGESKSIKINNITLSDLSMFYLQEEKLIKSLQLKANLYSGNIALDTIADLNQKEMPFNAFLSMHSVDIEELKNDTPIKDKTLAGTLNLEANSSGNLTGLADLRSKSLVEIKNGYLWGFNPLRKLADAISIISLDDIIFKEASGNFSIQNQKVYTDNLSLNSDELDIFLEGTIDFKGALDMLASIQAKESIQKSKNLSSILMSALGEITKVKISGTVNKPKTSVMPSVPTRNIVDNLKGIFNFD